MGLEGWLNYSPMGGGRRVVLGLGGGWGTLLEQKYIGRAQLQQGVASFQESYL